MYWSRGLFLWMVQHKSRFRNLKRRRWHNSRVCVCWYFRSVNSKAAYRPPNTSSWQIIAAGHIHRLRPDCSGESTYCIWSFAVIISMGRYQVWVYFNNTSKVAYWPNTSSWHLNAAGHTQTASLGLCLSWSSRIGVLDTCSMNDGVHRSLEGFAKAFRANLWSEEMACNLNISLNMSLKLDKSCVPVDKLSGLWTFQITAFVAQVLLHLVLQW